MQNPVYPFKVKMQMFLSSQKKVTIYFSILRKDLKFLLSFISSQTDKISALQFNIPFRYTTNNQTGL